jgi:hypothetical protein
MDQPAMVVKSGINLSRFRGVRLALGLALLALVALFAFAIYTGDPVFFFKWLVGLQADD